jgi:ankyrin repeat protein
MSLLRACEYGDLEMLKYLIENCGCDANYELGYSLVEIACMNGHLDVLKYLVEKGADMRIRKDCPLQFAAKNGHLDVVKFLVKRGADVRASNDYAFFRACEFGHLDVVQFLIEKGVNVNVHDDWGCAVGFASRFGYLEIVKLLIEKGADIHIYDNFAIRNAARNGHLEIVNLLIQNGADIHAQNDYAICHAARNGHLQIVKLLVQNGADIHAQNDYAICYAAQSNNLEMVKFLHENGAKFMNVALHWASEYGLYNIVKFFIEKGADVNWRNGDDFETGDTFAISRAFFNREFEVVKLLVENGANTHIPVFSDEDRHTIMSYISLRKKAEIRAANKIGSWWIPICYDLNRECGKRMMERSWERVKAMYEAL